MTSSARSNAVELNDVKLREAERAGQPAAGTTNEGFTEDEPGNYVNSSPQTANVDDSDDDEDDDDEDEANCFVRHVIACQLAVRTFWKQNSKYIKLTVLLIVVVLYLAYFGYAMYYKFGDEASVRLLWVTCLVFVCILLAVIKQCLRYQDVSLAECRLFLLASKHQNLINWVILAVICLFVVTFIIVDVSVVSRKPYNLVSLSGICIYLLLLFVFSYNPAKVRWQTVLWGISLQFIFALIVLRWSAGYTAFQWLGDRVTEFLSYTNAGSEFVFGEKYSHHFFAFQVLPTVIFFSAVISVLFYWRVMQFIIRKLSWIMEVSMATTAAESLNAAGNIFVGMVEAPLMIRPLLPAMTRSELHAVMTGGFATIAGGVLAAYVLFGVPANHLLSASVMSAPAALAVAKLFYPETRKSRTKADDVRHMEKSTEVNALDALSSGASNAVALVANIAANLIAFIAVLEFVNTTLTWFGQRVGIEELTFQIICSYILWPFALVMGVDVADCRKVAQMIGTKTFLNEFVAYQELSVFIDNRQKFDDHVANNGTWFYRDDDIFLKSGVNETVLKNGVISARSVLISTYALCGFSNIGSIGIQVGGLSAMAPKRRADIAAVALRAMIAGNIACFLTACIAGLFFQDV